VLGLQVAAHDLQQLVMSGGFPMSLR
jgi:hypothetical protein